MKSTLESVSPYDYYWQRKSLRKQLPHFAVREWWPSDELCDIERLYLQVIQSASSLLDIGAGDLRLKHKFQQCGFTGEYDTLDVGSEFDYTYQDLHEVRRSYDAVLVLDVVEHLPLAAGIEMLHRVRSLLHDGGVLILQTPNARCIRNPLGTDMTHVHLYNLPDLWTYLTCLAFSVEGYRVVFRQQHRGILDVLLDPLKAAITTRLLGCDYAENISVIVRKTNQAG